MSADPHESARTLAGSAGGEDTHNCTHCRLSVRLPIAAEMVGVSPSTLDRWRRAGLVPSTRIRGVRLFRVSDLARLLDEHADGGKGGAA